MPKPARRHHYLPQFYLAGFAVPSSKLVTVRSVPTGETKTVSPYGAAWVRDFYRVAVEGLAPDAVEANLSRLESDAAQVVRALEASQSIPSGDDYRILMTFIAFMALRVPAFRAAYEDPLVDVVRDVNRFVTFNAERWRAFLNQAGEKAARFKDLSHTEAAALLERGQFTVSLDTTYHVGVMLQNAPRALSLLERRKWSLATADPAQGDFITSDQPVYLGWTHPLPAFLRAGLALEHTEVVFPISSRSILVGSWEGPSGVVPFDRREIAETNNRLLLQTDEEIFYADDRFPLVDTASRIREARDVFAESPARDEA